MNNFEGISVIVPCYNHARFIARFIDSVLAQTKQEFELIICDDCSSDGSADIAASYDDPRIKLFRHKVNQGVSSTVNDAFFRAKGEYVSICGSDDMMMPHYLEKAWEFLKTHPDTDVFYPALKAIDDDDQPHPFFDKFRFFEGDKNQALHDMFLKNNILPSPGMMLRRSAGEKIFPAPVFLVNYSDYYWHVRLLLNGNFYQSSEKLICYRRMRDKSNLSGASAANKVRERYETFCLMDAFLSMTVTQIKEVFASELENLRLTTVTPETMRFVLGRLAMTAKEDARRMWGYEQILKSACTQEYAELLQQKYGFDFKSLLALSAETANRFFPKPKGCEKFFFKLFRHFEKKRQRKEAGS